jgi:hypothetical protein
MPEKYAEVQLPLKPVLLGVDMLVSVHDEYGVHYLADSFVCFGKGTHSVGLLWAFHFSEY